MTQFLERLYTNDVFAPAFAARAGMRHEARRHAYRRRRHARCPQEVADPPGDEDA